MGTDNSQAFVTENRERSKSRGRLRKSKDRSQSQSRRKFNYYHCGKERHIKRNCKAWKNRDKKNRRSHDTTNDKKITTPMTEREVVLLSFGEEECHVADSCTEWVVDLAASYYATYNKEFFTMYKAGDFGKVEMGNHSNADIVRVGDVCIQTSIGGILTLKDMRYVPDLRLNLISMHALDLVGYPQRLW